MTLDVVVPAGWTTIRLGDLFPRGRRGIEPAQYPEQEFELWSVPAFPSGAPEIVWGKDVGSNKQRVDPGDVLLCKINPRINRVWVVGQSGRLPQIASTEWIVLRGDDVDPHFLAHQLRESGFRDKLCADVSGIGGSLTRARPKAVAELRILVAPWTEQQRIVKRLGEMLLNSFNARAALSALHPQLERYKQSVLTAAFQGALTAEWRESHPDLALPWRESPWRDVGRCQNGRAFPSNAYSDQGIPLLRPGNLHVAGRVEWTDANTRYMSPSWAERFPKHVVGPGEIVMNLTAQSLKDEFLGRVCMMGDGDRCLLNQRIARLTPTDIVPRYAFWLFKSPLFRRYVDGLNTGSLIQHMFTSQVDDFELPVPSAAEQVEIVRRVEALLGSRDTLAALLHGAQERIQPLESALLMKAFRGELVPKDPDDEPAAATLARFGAQGTAASVSHRRSRAAGRA